MVRRAVRRVVVVVVGAFVAVGFGMGVAGAEGREVNQGYSIPVGAVTDLGALPVLGGLGHDFARLLGQG